MRIVHTSDTHLGHQQYARSDPDTGLNQREADITRAFNAIVDAALADPPDAFVHAGDLFDGVRPSNRALATAVEAFARLAGAGIPVVAIAGNHEHPKLRETGSPFRLFDHIDGVHPVYKGRRETVRIGGLTIHAVPQCADNDALRDEVAAIEPDAGAANILVVHGAVHTVEAFRNAEFNELSLNPRWFDDRFDYVALGHFHGAFEVTRRAWYCGAPERVSMAEAGEQKGYLDVRLDAGAEPDVGFRPLPGRPYMDLPRIDASGLDEGAVLEAVQAAAGRIPDGAVARIRIDGLGAHLRGLLDLREMHKAARHTMHCDIRLTWEDEAIQVRGGADIGPVADEFAAFAAKQPLEGLDRERVMALAIDVLGGA